MSFDQDPYEQVNISGSDFAILVAEHEFLKDMLAWAYGKLQHNTFSKMDDAMMADSIKLYLEHGVTS